MGAGTPNTAAGAEPSDRRERQHTRRRCPRTPQTLGCAARAASTSGRDHGIARHHPLRRPVRRQRSAASRHLFNTGIRASPRRHSPGHDVVRLRHPLLLRARTGTSSLAPGSDSGRLPSGTRSTPLRFGAPDPTGRNHTPVADATGSDRPAPPRLSMGSPTGSSDRPNRRGRRGRGRPPPVLDTRTSERQPVRLSRRSPRPTERSIRPLGSDRLQ